MYVSSLFLLLQTTHAETPSFSETAEWHGSDSENDSEGSDDEDGSDGGSDDDDEEMDGDDGRAPPAEPIEIEQELEVLKLTDAEMAAIEAEKLRVEVSSF